MLRTTQTLRIRPGNAQDRPELLERMRLAATAHPEHADELGRSADELEAALADEDSSAQQILGAWSRAKMAMLWAGGTERGAQRD